MEAAFWDASAFVPLCVEENASQPALQLFAQFAPVIWWSTPVEVHGAIARLQRMRMIDITRADLARRDARDRAALCHVIVPSDDIREFAFQVLDEYDLKAADALQLAAALRWRGRNANLFVSANKKLRSAALQAGFNCPEL